MSQRTLDTQRIVRLLLADAVATLGESVRPHVLAVAANMENNNARVWLAQGMKLAQVQAHFDREVVDLFQQHVHDEHWDTTWPTCPLHPKHPLWYDADREAWYCPRDRTPLAPLGGLAGLYPSATE
jgi:hypothetical protein